MNNLLKADFYKLIKSKSCYVAPVVAAVLILIGVLLEWSMAKLSSGAVIPAEVMLSLGYTSRSFVFGASSSANLRLLILIMCCLFVCGDYAGGTMRLQLATGENRFAVYFSKVIVLSVYAVGLVIFSVLVSAAISSCFFSYGVEFTGAEFGLLMRSIAISAYVAVGYVVFYSFIAFSVRTTGGSIGVCIVEYLFLSVVVAVISAFTDGLDNLLMYVLNTIEQYAALTTEFVTKDILYVVFVPLVTIVVSGAAGSLIFWKRDIK